MFSGRRPEFRRALHMNEIVSASSQQPQSHSEAGQRTSPFARFPFGFEWRKANKELESSLVCPIPTELRVTLVWDQVLVALEIAILRKFWVKATIRAAVYL